MVSQNLFFLSIFKGGKLQISFPTGAWLMPMSSMRPYSRGWMKKAADP